MTMSAQFELYLEIIDEESLIAAAREKSLEDGVTEEEFADWIADRGVGAALVALLDPGSLPGCKILDSATSTDPAWKDD